MQLIFISIVDHIMPNLFDFSFSANLLVPIRALSMLLFVLKLMGPPFEYMLPFIRLE